MMARFVEKPMTTRASRKEVFYDKIGMVGISSQTRLLRKQIRRYGVLRGTVLITGETGTGKELVARGLHAHSSRADGHLVSVNCGTLTGTLLEDTLFGHEKGAFTGATRTRKGVFEQAHGGTLFLDEIGELTLPQQTALLRVIEDRRVRRIGAEREETTDFRLVTSTNRNLSEMVDMGRFRLDLYHRLATLEITTTPLRNRLDDIEPLAECFLAQMVDEVGECTLNAEALAKLQCYRWPGNVRELRNVLYRSAAHCCHKLLKATDIDIKQFRYALNRRSYKLSKVSDVKIEYLVERNGGNVAAAARELGVPRSSLRDRIGKLIKHPMMAMPGNLLPSR